ncbi:hypothetical protein MKW98_017908 [Papaver atlanticum]|uniref:Nucleolar GTP-binding protein 1 n=1 Tax=Papaver atlanticum TaxID=357466 RepID=A0AAD4XVY8_9MAGN|nr:hypothetical protein MKW98_017908 [Papaver atlanticum]
MVQYNFKKIRVVPNGKEFVNITLSCTQRQTPTIIHKGYAINRIRQFYMRKVKYTQTNFHEKLSSIVDDFPRLDDIHPFYGDLLHVLYNKDHYKLALGQINSARRLISKIAKDYLKLLKYGDSLYRCKSLKVAALGQMCTVVKRIGPSLAYLEQIRQHMARLPSIDPNTRTILICGYPNVGKSSFINKIPTANVDVQPYAFTTKSLFVGHTNYKCLRYQVIDTPGVLDRPFEDRNIIEMCSITAPAHLRASVLFFLDISGSCGYSISQQAALFHSIKSLFVNKPSLDGLSEEDMKLVREMKDEAAKSMVGEGGEPSDNANVLLTMSTLTEDGVISVKNAACEKLLNQRVELKMNSKKITDCLNRFHVGIPKPRDQKERPHCIPQSVLEFKAKEAAEIEEKKLERDLENENGGAGVYTSNLKKHYILEHDEWKEDIMPEILDGHNVHDFMDDGKELTPEEQETEAEIRNNPIVPASGLNPSLAIKRAASTGVDDNGDAMDIDNHADKKLCSRGLSRPRSRSSSKPPGEVIPGEGFKNRARKVKALKLARNSSKKSNKQSRVGEADGVIANLKPKHLFSGKRSNGKANRR